jgi:hypothetical protein
VVSQRRIQGIPVILDGIGGIKLVSVLAIEDSMVPSDLEMGLVRKGELVHQPPFPQGLLYSRVPPHLRVVVAG